MERIRMALMEKRDMLGDIPAADKGTAREIYPVAVGL